MRLSHIPHKKPVESSLKLTVLLIVPTLVRGNDHDPGISERAIPGFRTAPSGLRVHA